MRSAPFSPVTASTVFPSRPGFFVHAPATYHRSLQTAVLYVFSALSIGTAIQVLAYTVSALHITIGDFICLKPDTPHCSLSLHAYKGSFPDLPGVARVCYSPVPKFFSHHVNTMDFLFFFRSVIVTADGFVYFRSL